MSIDTLELKIKLEGKNLEIEVPDDITVATLRELIIKQLNIIDVSIQKLLYNGIRSYII